MANGDLDDDTKAYVGCVSALILGLLILIPTINLGPIDALRTLYNQSFGDTPVLRRELLDYARRDIQRKNSHLDYNGIEKILADELGAKLENNRINIETVSFEELWDISEEHAKSSYQRWVWTSLKE